MTDTEDILETLHSIITKALCEERGEHEWVAIESPSVTMNTVPMERCQVCGKTRTRPFDASTTNQDMTFDGETMFTGMDD